MKYRPDIDGLRAVAVLPVVFYHAKLGITPGGFVGVDVFFVISGYLITRIIWDELSQDRFSLLNFYERRVRRIIPAYVVVSVFTLFVGWFLLLPEELDRLGKSVFFSAVFLSNLHFYRHSDYFSPDLDTYPFLHTWSLSVEEQFYIAFPLILMILATRLFSKLPASVYIFVGLILSLLLAELAINTHWNGRSLAFYMTPLRAWELMAGALLAVTSFPSLANAYVRHALAFVGLALILFSVFFYDSGMVFPGFAAVPPVLGAALLIYTGSGQDGGQAGVNGLLSSPILVWIGKISYSLYLWHLPVTVYVEALYLGQTTLFAKIGIVIVSIVLAYASLILVERPFRERRVAARRLRLFAYAGGASAFAATVSMAFALSDGLPQRITSPVSAISAFDEDKSDLRFDCHVLESPMPHDDLCTVGAEGVVPSYVVWGDSHAISISDQLGEYATGRNLSGLHISAAACPPATNFDSSFENGCRALNSYVLEMVSKDDEIKVVFLIARYNFYLKRHTKSLGGWERDFLTGFEEVVKALTNANKRVVVVYPIPEYPVEVPPVIARAAMLGVRPPTVPLREHRTNNQAAFEFIDHLKRSYKGVRTIDTSEILCSNDQCEYYIDEIVTHYDGDHLSLSGARLVLDPFISHLDPAVFESSH